MARHDETDRGPWARLHPDDIEALERYGCDVCRQEVVVKVQDVGHYSFKELPDTLDGWLEYLAAMKAKVPEAHRTEIGCRVEWEPGCYDSGDSARFVIEYTRPETDEEMEKRVGDALLYLQNQAAKQAHRDRAEYERLKAKFGDK